MAKLENPSLTSIELLMRTYAVLLVLRSPALENLKKDIEDFLKPDITEQIKKDVRK